MEDKPRKMYRIGEYARKMGVTTDLLKHYEDVGLVCPETAGNGYRYYPFHQSFRLLESMKLHSYGLTLREIKRILTEMNEAEVRAALAENAERMEKQLDRQRQVLNHYRAITEDIDAIGPAGVSWFVTKEPAMLFLPHTEKRTFVDDERVYEILRDWIDAMPMARPAMMIPAAALPGADWREDFRWGLAVPEDFARASAVPVNGAVERFPGGRCLKVLYRDAEVPDASSPFAYLGALMTRLGERPASPVLRIELFSAHDDAGTAVHYGCFLVALESSRL